MALSYPSKYALSIVAGAALLAGCASGGDALTPSGALVPGPNSKAAGAAWSWMSPDLRRTKLIYISDSATDDVYVYTLDGKLVGTLADQNNPAGLCTDKHDDIFVTQLYGDQILEYRHGGTRPIAALSDPGYHPGACSVNPYTGDLAVANVVSDDSTQGNFVVYHKAKGKPTTYLPPGGASGGWFSVNAVGYPLLQDDELYFAGTCGGAFCAGLLPYGSGTTENVRLNVAPKTPGTVQFDSEYMTFDDQSDGTVYQYKFNGTSGTEVGAVKLPGSSLVDGSWICFVTYRKSKHVELYVLAPQQNSREAILYSYPPGRHGRAFTGLTQPFGATFSGLYGVTY